MAQQAFNACMILLLDALERRSVTLGAMKAEKAYVVFQDLQNVHSLASLAVDRISWGLKKLHDVTQSAAGAPGPRETSCNDADMQEAWRDALHGPHAMCDDTVMNATGMFLLEDPGLQGFVPEAFAPISWNLGGIEPPMPFELKTEGRGARGVRPVDSPLSDDDINDFRSTGLMQGMRRSTTLRSAPTRYATPTLDDRPPPSVTAPTSVTDSTGSLQHHADSQSNLPKNHRLDHPPHLTDGQLCSHSKNGWEHPAVATSTDQRPSPYRGGPPGLHRDSAVQMRHNSCPTLHDAANTTTLQRPTYSSPAAPRAQTSTKTRTLPGSLGISDQAHFDEFLNGLSHFTSPETASGVNASWALRPAERTAITHLQDAALDCMLPLHIGSAAPDPLQGAARDQMTTSAYPVQFSEAALMDTPLGTEHMSLDEWRHWIGSSAAG